LHRINNGPCFAGDLSGFGGDRDQRRFRDRGAEPERERKQQQNRPAALTRHRLGHGLADGKQAHFQALHKQRQPENTQANPTRTLVRSGNGCCRTMI